MARITTLDSRSTVTRQIPRRGELVLQTLYVCWMMELDIVDISRVLAFKDDLRIGMCDEGSNVVLPATRKTQSRP